jgi:hypothetical protein
MSCCRVILLPLFFSGMLCYSLLMVIQGSRRYNTLRFSQQWWCWHRSLLVAVYLGGRLFIPNVIVAISFFMKHAHCMSTQSFEVDLFEALVISSANSGIGDFATRLWNSTISCPSLIRIGCLRKCEKLLESSKEFRRIFGIIGFEDL